MYKLIRIKLVIIQIDNNRICAKTQPHIQIYKGVVSDTKKDHTNKISIQAI